VWGYGAVSSASHRGLLLHNAPSLTIEADYNRPVRVKWISELVDAHGNYLPHLLPVDPTLHWANPPGGPTGRDTRPTFQSTPGRYTGPVPIVTHVHGAVGVVDDSDGDAEAWYLPAATNIPTGYATEGPWYDFFAAKAAAAYGATWGPGFATFQYPNANRASTIWYHDHTLGMTRLNVYAGPAGFYILRGGPAGDDAVLDSRCGSAAVLPGPAERADLIVDFTNVPVGNYVLGNVGPDEPFGGGVPGVDFPIADPATTGQVMEFRVVPAVGLDPTTPPMFLQLPAITPLPIATVTRPLALLEEMSAFFPDAPAETLLGTVAGDPNVAPGVWTKRLWMDPVTENPAVGATEIWEFYNATVDAHPMHIHEVAFQVVNRQAISVDEATQQVQVVTGSVPTPPEPWETGFKDTVIAYPGQVTRVKVRFNTPGQFVWHCHIVEHEDNEMMRPYRIGPVQPGQPGGM